MTTTGDKAGVIDVRGRLLLAVLLVAGLGLCYAGVDRAFLKLPGLGAMTLSEVDREVWRAVRVLVAVAAVVSWFGMREAAWFLLGGAVVAPAVALLHALGDARALASGGGAVGEAASGVLAGTVPGVGMGMLAAGLVLLCLGAWRGGVIRRRWRLEVGGG